MTWVKIPDDALDDPKVAELAPKAIVAYLRTLGWSNRWARDGRIPRSIAGEQATVWTDAGLAEAADDAVQLVWLLEHQPKSDEIIKRKADAADRQERHRRHMAGDHSKCDAKRCHVLIKAATRDETREQRRDKRPLRSISDPSPPEGRGEETGDGSGEPPAPSAAGPTALGVINGRAVGDVAADLERDFPDRYAGSTIAGHLGAGRS